MHTTHHTPHTTHHTPHYPTQPARILKVGKLLRIAKLLKVFKNIEILQNIIDTFITKVHQMILCDLNILELIA